MVPGLGRSPGGAYSIQLQYSCLENPMDRGAWWAMVHRVAKVGQDEVTEHALIYKGPKSILDLNV